MTEIQTTPDDTPELRASDIQPSWAGFGGSQAATAGEAFMGGLRTLKRIHEYSQAASGEEGLGSQISRLQTGEDLNQVLDAPRHAPELPVGEVNARVKQEGLEGRLPHPSTNSAALELQLQEAHEARDREVALARGPNGFIPGALGLVTSLGVGMIDPVNAAAFMVPVGGEAFWGARLAAQTGMAGRFAVKAAQGAAQGAVGGAALVPAEWWLKTQDGQDYTMSDALSSVVQSAGMGAAFHAGFGSIGDILRRGRGQPLKGSTEDLQLRAIAGDTHAAALLERMGKSVTRQQEPGDIPGITAAEHPLPAPPPPAEGEKLHPARQVFDDAREQLYAAGMSAEAAEQNAAIVAARYETRAARLGGDRDAYDLYKSEGLTIRRPDETKEVEGRAFAQGKPVEPGLFAEREAEGQAVLPGGERISDAELAQRRADQALKPKVAQKPMDVGLFGDESKQKTLFQSERAAPTFYSATERAVASAKQEKASPEQWLATIKNTPGVKGEELAWLGLEDWLKEQKGSVTKQQLADYVRANAIEVKEVEYRQTGPSGWGVAGSTKFETYRLPGGENYRELLLTLPATSEETIGARLEKLQIAQHNAEEAGDAALAQRIHREALALADRGETVSSGETAFRSSHWDEPNVLAHVRFDGRTIDGKRTLHIAEVQSDWHQAGRRAGYSELTPAEKVELNDLSLREIHAAEDRSSGDREGVPGLTEVESARIRDLERRNGDVPDAPFKTTWPELSLKRMIRYAAENGYDQISWDTGATNAERYDLSKQVDRIRSAQGFNNTYRLEVYPKSGSSFVENDVPRAKLADMVGKDLADKIVDFHDAPGKDVATGDFSGLDLKVGGEGMRGFYDKMLPAAADKLGKKFGAKVGEAAVPVERQWDGVDEAGRSKWNAAGGRPVHTLPITPQLRDAAIRHGFPLFQAGEGTPRGRITIAENRAVIDLFAKADRSTFMHEAGHLWLEEMIRDGSAENAPQGLKDDLKTILDWLGVAKPEDITTAHHEQWARGFEQYLAEGKAPSSRLAQAFAKFKEWLTAIYHSLASLDAPLSPQVRGVMDRMLASDEEIAQMRNAPPHPAEVLADLPPAAREDAVRAATADVIAGRPVRAAEMLNEAAKEDPRIAESLERPPGTQAAPTPVQSVVNHKIDATHDVVSGANSSRDPNGPVYIDRRIPEFSPGVKDRNGQPANLWKYLSTHERDEAQRMARGEPYDAAHQAATKAERAAVEADGVDWAAYTREIDGYLSRIEHEKAENPPPDTHVDPQAAIGHHRSENKAAAAPQPARRIDTSNMTLALPPAARSMIDDAERYKLAAKLRRERTGGAGAVTMYPTAAARDRARGISVEEGRERHAAAEKAFDAMVAEHGIEDLPEDVRTLAIEAVRDRGLDPDSAFDYASAKVEREALEHEHFLSTLKGEELDGLDAARHVIATEDGDHDLHGDIPFGPGGAAAEGGRQVAGQAGLAPEDGQGARPGRQGAQQAGPGRGAAAGGVRLAPGEGRGADFKKFGDVAHPVADPDLASASKTAEKAPEPESTEPAKAVSAAQAAATEADKLLADILPNLSPQEREVFERALFELDQDRDARAQIVRDGAACLAAAVA